MIQSTTFVSILTHSITSRQYSIEDDIILFEIDGVSIIKPYPFKIDAIVISIVIRGESRGTYNLHPFVLKANTYMVVLPGQILTKEYQSDDYKAKHIVLSNKFIAMLGKIEGSPSFVSLAKTPVITLTDSEFQAALSFYDTLQEIVINNNNPYRLEAVKHLALAFFYSKSKMFSERIVPEQKSLNKQQWIVEEFMTLIQNDFKQERGMQFYADKLCITPKYLSILIKRSTGISGNEWIDRHVALEAKALLKSTNMTVQQISDELNFQSQSFFGKYFKRVVGMSPSEYKKL